jgi:hypothetical protein
LKWDGLSWFGVEVTGNLAQQLTNFIEDNQLLDKHQSAYRAYHSTETALIKVTSDIMKSIDNGHLCILLLLDLSAAFDTIDHEILIWRLENSFGITGQALEWIS